MVLGVHADVEQRVLCHRHCCGGSWPGHQQQQGQHCCHRSARATAGQDGSTERRGDSRDKVLHCACGTTAAHGHCPGPPTVGSGILPGGCQGSRLLPGGQLGSRFRGTSTAHLKGCGAAQPLATDHGMWECGGLGSTEGREETVHPAVSWIDTHAYHGSLPTPRAAGIHPPELVWGQHQPKSTCGCFSFPPVARGLIP